jgi:hypothetical protein
MNKIFNYNGNSITFQKGDNVMVNATEMAKSFGKRPIDWLKTEQSDALLKALTKVKNLTLANIVQVIKGGNNPGTWMHEDVAMLFAQWLSPDFYLWCNDRVKELLKNGVTTISKPLSTLDILEQSIKQLRKQEQRVEVIEKDVLELKAATKTRPDYFTIVGYATLNKIEVGLKVASSLGKKATSVCKKLDYITETIPDPRFGIVKTYPKEVLKKVFDEHIVCS